MTCKELEGMWQSVEGGVDREDKLVSKRGFMLWGQL